MPPDPQGPLFWHLFRRRGAHGNLGTPFFGRSILWLDTLPSHFFRYLRLPSSVIRKLHAGSIAPSELRRWVLPSQQVLLGKTFSFADARHP
jgi:hypothetical protein